MWGVSTTLSIAQSGCSGARCSPGKWSRPAEVVNGVQSPELRYACWNPVLFLPKNDPLMLFYKVGPSPARWWGMLTTSTDDGQTWKNMGLPAGTVK